MNILKALLQNIGLLGGVIFFYILDVIPILADDTVTMITGLYLKVIKVSDPDKRVTNLREFFARSE